jgi:hypothetical protein
MAGRGFRFEGSIRAGRSGATTVRLVDPSGAVAWSRTAEARGSEPIPSTILTTEGVWRLEIDGRGKAVWVELTGDLETSRWGSVPWGSTLPIAWIAAGILAAVAVWCGVWGARASGLVLLLAGLTMPVLTRGIRDLFSDLPPGEPAMILATALLSTCGAVVLGSTWPHPGARTVGVVAIVVGSALIAAGFAAMRSSDPCVENPCLPFERLDELVAEAGMAIGLIVLAVGGWRLGRAWARPVRLAAGETRPGVGAAGA